MSNFAVSSASPPSVAKTTSATVAPELDLDSVEVTAEKLSHPTAGRAKAPKRRPPSSAFVRESVSTLLCLPYVLFYRFFVRTYVVRVVLHAL